MSSYKIVFLRRFVNSQDCMLQKVSQFLRLSFKIVFFKRLIYFQDCMLQKLNQFRRWLINLQGYFLQKVNQFTRLSSTSCKSVCRIIFYIMYTTSSIRILISVKSGSETLSIRPLFSEFSVYCIVYTEGLLLLLCYFCLELSQ